MRPSKFSDYYFNRGGAYHLKGNNALAISDMEKAIRIDPNIDIYHIALKDLKKIK